MIPINTAADEKKGRIAKNGPLDTTTPCQGHGWRTGLRATTAYKRIISAAHPPHHAMACKPPASLAYWSQAT
jgi:hypothetical protein